MSAVLAVGCVLTIAAGLFVRERRAQRRRAAKSRICLRVGYEFAQRLRLESAVAGPVRAPEHWSVRRPGRARPAAWGGISGRKRASMPENDDFRRVLSRMGNTARWSRDPAGTEQLVDRLVRRAPALSDEQRQAVRTALDEADQR